MIVMTRRRLMVLGAACIASGAGARTGRGLRRIAFLIGADFPTMTAAFLGELERLGYHNGRNLIIDVRLGRSNSNDLATHIADLAGREVDLVVAASLPVALAVRRAMPDVPLVIATAPGLVSNGFADSIQRPGRNATGIDELPPGLTAHRLRLLKEIAPELERVALLSTTPGTGGHEAQLADAQSVASELGIRPTVYRARTLDELDASLGRIEADAMHGLVNFQGALSLVNRERILALTDRLGMPAIYQSQLFVRSGGLMSYAPDQDEQFRMSARYADRILRGARAGDLPIVHPPRYFLTLNRSAARRQGLTVPPRLLAAADTLID